MLTSAWKVWKVSGFRVRGLVCVSRALLYMFDRFGGVSNVEFSVWGCRV